MEIADMNSDIVAQNRQPLDIIPMRVFVTISAKQTLAIGSKLKRKWHI
jgi:hypothetical protein